MITPARLASLVALTALAAGCISVDVAGSGDKPELHRHTLDGTAGVTARRASEPGLAVRPFGARARYDMRVVRREDGDGFSYLEYERWGEVPADAATDAVREDLAASGAFAFVSSSVDALSVDRYLDGYVLGFDLVRAAKGPWKARFAARLTLSDRDGKMLHAGVYESVRDLPGDSPAGLGPAMAAAVADAVNHAVADWTAPGK